MTTIQLSKNVRQLRKSRGMTQKEIAEKLFIDERTYSKFERGEKKSIDIRFLNSVAKVLQTDLLTLIKSEEDDDDNSPIALTETDKNEAMLSLILNSLKESQSEIVLEIRQLEHKIENLAIKIIATH